MANIIRQIALTILALGMVLFMSCGPDDDSELHDLVNLVGKFRANNCAGNMSDSEFAKYADLGPDGTPGKNSKFLLADGVLNPRKPDGTRTELSLALQRAVGAVPENIRRSFFEVYGGKIFIDSFKAADVCNEYINEPKLAASFGYERTGSPISICWSDDPKTNVNIGKPTIFVAADSDQKSIRHGMVRSFAYIFAQRMLQEAYDTVRTEEDRRKIVERRRAIRALTKVFMHDIKYVYPEAYNRLADLNPFVLQNYIFSESMDSYYCSPETRRDFNDKERFPAFQNTYKLFTGGGHVILPDKTEVHVRSFVNDFGRANN